MSENNRDYYQGLPNVSEQISDEATKNEHRYSGHRVNRNIRRYRREIAKHRKLRRKLSAVMTVFVAVILMLAIALTVVSVNLANMRGLHKAVYSDLGQIETSKNGEWVSLYNYSLGDIRIPAVSGVPKSVYKNEGFREDEHGYKQYYEGDELCSYVGIDVSSHNGIVNWYKVKASGIDFVMIRAGGRGYGEEGVLYNDEYLIANLQAARRAGLMVGVYFFSQARTAEEAAEEAEYTVELLAGEKLDYPIAFDWEIVESAESTRIDNVSPEVLTECARTFCDKIKEHGYKPMLYTGSSLAYYKYDLAELSDIDIWYAYYNNEPSFYYNYMIWQYSCTGEVEGIDGYVDLNICFKNYK